MVQVRQVLDRADRNRFIRLPYTLHRNDPAWVPPLLIEQRDLFNPKTNPFFDHGRMHLYLAEKDGRITGRVAAIDDDNHNRTHGDNLLFFGFFEAEDAETAAALYRQVEDKARELGRGTVRGPANPTMNDGSGFQINAFDEPPFLMMPQNPASYPEMAVANGYAKVMDLYAWRFNPSAGASERLNRLADRAAGRTGVTIRPLDMKNFERDAASLKRLYDEAWENNWGFVKYTDREFAALVKGLKMIVEPSLALFAEVDGRLAGAAIALPDVNQVFARMGGRLFPTGIFSLLRRKSIVTRARLPILGIMPEFRNRGLELVLIRDVTRAGAALGYTDGECSWVLESNEAMNRGIEVTGGELYKTYRLFQKSV